MAEQVDEALQILRLRQVMERTGLSRATIYEKIKRNNFPHQIPLGNSARAVGWLAHEIDAWIAEQRHARDDAISRRRG